MKHNHSNQLIDNSRKWSGYLTSREEYLDYWRGMTSIIAQAIEIESSLRAAESRPLRMKYIGNKAVDFEAILRGAISYVITK